MQLTAALTMQEAEPAGWVQRWESWISPPPHLCLQLVPFTKLSPTWCNRFGSTVPGRETQETQSEKQLLRPPSRSSGSAQSRTSTDPVLAGSLEPTVSFSCSPSGGDAGPAVVQLLVLVRDADWGDVGRWRQADRLSGTFQEVLGPARCSYRAGPER